MHTQCQKGTVPLLMVLGVVVVVGGMMLSTRLMTHALKRNILRKSAEGKLYYAGEIGAWGAHRREKNLDSRAPDYQAKLNQTAGGWLGSAFITNLVKLKSYKRSVQGIDLFCGGADFTFDRAFHGEATIKKELCLKGVSCNLNPEKGCFITEPVDQLYRSLLGRDPSGNEALPFVSAIANGEISIQELESQFRDSVEYFGRSPDQCENSMGEKYSYSKLERTEGAGLAEDVTALFRVFYGRFPSEGEVKAGVVKLLGCPTGNSPVIPIPFADYARTFASSTEFTDPDKNNSRLHGEPLQELFVSMLGRYPLVYTPDFPAFSAAVLNFWIGRMVGQFTANVNEVVSVLAPPFKYGEVVGTILNAGVRKPFTSNAISFREIVSSPDTSTGFAESTTYLNTGGGNGETIIALYRTLLNRVPKGPYPQEEIQYYSQFLSAPYDMPLTHIADTLKASADFAGRASSGCQCTTLPSPRCQLIPDKTTVNVGETVTFSLYVIENNQLDSNNRIRLGPPPPTWDGVTPSGTVTSVSWNGNQTILPGVATYTFARTAAAGEASLTETALVGGPGGNGICEASVQVNPVPPKSCTVVVRRRGNGASSVNNANGRGGRTEPLGPYAIGGGTPNPHSYYYTLDVFIPAVDPKDLIFSTNFRSGSGYLYTGSRVPEASYSYDPCNRNSECGGNPIFYAANPAPATFDYLGVNYQLMTRLSDGTAQDYVNGGVCGSADCQCYLSGVISPLILKLGEGEIELVSEVAFDLGEGRRDYFWPSPESRVAFLVLDKNENHQIDDFNELFGSSTLSPTGTLDSNGFLALSHYDENDDKRIDRHDGVYHKLQLWFDRNANGLTERGELSALADHKVHSLTLSYQEVQKPIGPFGNIIAQESRAYTKDHKPIPFYDLWLVQSGLRSK